MACGNLPDWAQAPAINKFTPFTVQDCANSELPGQNTPEVEAGGNGIYCQFSGIAMDPESNTLQGVAFLNLGFTKDAAVAGKGYDSDHANLESEIPSATKNKATIKTIYDQPDELMFLAIYANNSPGVTNPDESLYAVELFKSHFVIQVKGSILNTSEDDAVALVKKLVDFAENRALFHLGD